MFLLCDNNDLINGENQPSNVSKNITDQHNVHKTLTVVQQLHQNSLTNDFILSLVCDLKGQ